MKSQAIQKIDDGAKAYRGSNYGNAMKDYVARIMKDFCARRKL